MKDLKLHGILAAIVTPFTEAGEVDHPALRAYLEWLVGEGVHAVVVHADSGEGHALTPAEREQITRTAADTIDGRIPIVAGLIAQSTAEAVRLGLQDRAAGADALMVFSPTSFLGTPLPPEVPEAYYAAIAAVVDLPLVAFQLQASLGGCEYTPDALRRILSIEHVIAIKESTFDALKFRTTMRLVRTLGRDISYLSGNDNFIYESFALGADGCLIGFGTLASREQVAIYDAVQAGDLVAAAEIYDRIAGLVDAIFQPPIRDYRGRMKAALVALEVIPNALVRAPLPQIGAAESDAIRRTLIDAGLLALGART
jgi:dihydrodipicolinate synthase/N-acetylneuraminate lyase